jgi:hypothetical protein
MASAVIAGGVSKFVSREEIYHALAHRIAPGPER